VHVFCHQKVPDSPVGEIYLVTQEIET
jgi:hypothetical protein